MHIADGFLPASHAVAWSATALPFVVHGTRRLSAAIAASPAAALRVGAVGGFTLLMSSLKLPSVAGSSSHPSGTSLGAMACGPAVMSALGVPVLVLQALLMAHGGLTTLGANVFSMCVAGPWAAWLCCRATSHVLPRRWAIGVATAVGVLATYGVTACQLALAFPDPVSGVPGALLKFGAIFLPAQAPLAVAEAVFTVAAWETLAAHVQPGLVRRA
ncbi:MAG: energy-coupling factor ABC transporter permease [Acidimicrobiia bacterium]|nr:energy-coupling factor ABC transporter permease [Acidimicrobiia bacterium]